MLEKITKDIKAFFGKNLVSLVLFGSYAARRQMEISDIDIFAMAD